MSGELSRFAPGFDKVAAAGERAVMLQVDGASEVVSVRRREWVILLSLLSGGPPEEVARRATLALQTALGARAALSSCDGLPRWYVAALLTLSPWGRPNRAELKPVCAREVAGAIGHFRAAGLIVDLALAPVKRADPIALSIVIITCDRPRALERCLMSLKLEHFAETVPGGELIVCDNSTSQELREANESIARRIRREHRVPVAYFGERHRRELTKRIMSATGIESRTVHFGLFGRARPTIGANRNTALLLGAGRRIIVLDDDIVPRVWLPWETRVGAALTSIPEPRQFVFEEAHDRLAQGFVQRPEGLWCAHSEYLGRHVADVATSYQAATEGDASGTFVPGRYARRGKVRATLNGVIGDLGMGWLRGLLVLPSPARRSLVRSAAVYSAALQEGIGRRTSSEVYISPVGRGASGGTGLDCRTILPPYSPSYRCEDVLFLDVLRRVDPGSTVAFLPEATEHRPLERRQRDADSISQNTDIRMWHVLDWVLKNYSSTALAVEGETNLQRLSKAFASAGSLSELDVQGVLRAVWLSHAVGWMSALDSRLAEFGSEPSWWLRDVQRLRDRFASQIDSDVAGIPSECHGQAHAAADLVRSYLRDMGELFGAWPALWDYSAARNLLLEVTE